MSHKGRREQQTAGILKKKLRQNVVMIFIFHNSFEGCRLNYGVGGIGGSVFLCSFDLAYDCAVFSDASSILRSTSRL